MNNDNNPKKPLTNPSDSDAKSPPPKTSSSTSGKTIQKNTAQDKITSLIAICALLLATIAFAGTVIAWKNSSFLKNNLTQSSTELTSSVKQNISALQSQSTKLETLQQQLIALTEQNKLQRQAIHKLMSNATESTQYWELKQVAAMINLANLNLHYNYDVDAATSLLNAANAIVENLNDPEYNQLRQQISDNVTALNNLPKLDWVKLLDQINNVSATLAKVPLKTNTPSDTIEKEVSQNVATTFWKRVLDEATGSLQKWVIIRHNKEPIPPPLLPSEQENIVKNLQLKLSQTEWALLRRNAALYQQSLTTVIDWINSYFAVDKPETQALLQELNSLKSIDINPELPDLNKTATLVNELLANLPAASDNKPKRVIPEEEKS